MEIRQARKLFPSTDELVYLNAAACSPLATTVVDAMHAAALRRSRSGDHGFHANMATVERTREAAARLIGATAGDIAFVQNTADGIGRVAIGLEWRDGDEVVVGDLEYPANVYPWAAHRDRGVRLRIVESEKGTLDAERLIAAVGPRTRVVAVSFVQFTSGYRVDLAALGRACRQRDILLVVDAIQGLGVFPVDVVEAGIGALAVDGRKWLLGPQGAGFLYVSPDWVPRIKPRIAGAVSVPEFGDHLRYLRRLDPDGQIRLEEMLRPGAGRYEAGFYNVTGLAGLGEALMLGESVGHDRVERHVTNLVERLVNGIVERGWDVYGPRTRPERSGIVAFAVPGDAERIVARLIDERVFIAARDSRLRVSPHLYNTPDEIDALLDRLGALLEG